MLNKIRKLSHFMIGFLSDKIFNEYITNLKGKVVDLGCGTKPYKYKIEKYANEYIGIDWDNSLHDVHPDIVSDLNKKIELPDNFADGAISISVMEHLKEPEIFLKETYRILKPNSYFILQVPFQWWVHEPPYDYYRYTPYGLKYLFEKSGFKILEIRPVGGFFTMWFTKLNYFLVRMFKLPRILWIIWIFCLVPFWIIFQVVGVILDKIFDRNWELETQGYFVLARKK